MKKVIALFGESGSGKDYIAKYLQSNFEGIHKLIQHTTRPKRSNEKNGEDYYFVNEDDFFDLLWEHELLDFNTYRGWEYGYTLREFREDKINLGVFNINEIKSLKNESSIKVLPVYIYCDDYTRLMRCLQRQKDVDCYEVCRRFISDIKDFSKINFSFITFDNKGDKDPINFFEIPSIKDFIKDSQIV